LFAEGNEKENYFLVGWREVKQQEFYFSFPSKKKLFPLFDPDKLIRTQFFL